MLRDVRKCSIAIVAIQDYASEAGDEQIRPPIVVVVAHDRAHCPAGIADARLIRNVREGSIVIIVVKRARAFLPESAMSTLSALVK